MLAQDFRTLDRVLRYAAILVFDSNVHILVRQDFATEVENLHEAICIEPVINIVSNVSLEQADVRGVVQRPAAVDEALRDMADFRNVKVSGDVIAIRKNKRGNAVGWLCRRDLSSLSFIIVNKNILV